MDRALMTARATNCVVILTELGRDSLVGRWVNL